MTTTEHLTKIRAQCVELLAIAEKRTVGEWHHVDSLCAEGPDEVRQKLSGIYIGSLPMPEDALFITSCVGSAEAGWRSTIAVIDVYCSNELDSESHRDYTAVIDAILAAWPEELL